MSDFEEVAERFYLETGVTRPGKDISESEYSDETREKCFRVWVRQEKTIKEIEQKLRDTDYQSRLKNTKIRDLTARVEELENGFVKGDATQTHLNFWTLMHQG